MQRHEHDRRVVVVELVGVGHQADLLEERVDRLEVAGRADQLGQVLDAALGLDGVLGLELGHVARALHGGLEQPAAGPSAMNGGEVVEQRQERPRCP